MPSQTKIKLASAIELSEKITLPSSISKWLTS